MNLRMTVQKSPKVRDEFRHDGPLVRIGRNPDGELVLDHDAVSWDHARIELSPYQATIVDLGSTNGTFKNGQKIAGSTPLWPGDAIKFGQTGPTVSVVELDLTSNGPVPPPVAKPAVKAAKKAAPVVSETRGIAIQAVQELIAQQEAHARHKRTFTAVTLSLLLLLLLLAGGLFYFRNELGLAIGKQGEQIGKVKDDLDHQRAEFGKLAGNVSDGFAKVDKEFADQRERDAKTEEKLREFALNAAKQEAATRGIPDKIKDLGVSLDQLNDRLAKANAGPAGGNAPRNPPVAPLPRAIPAFAKAIRIEPGQKIDVILKDDHLYTGSLVAFDGRTVKVQTIPDPNAKPSEWDIRKVQAFQTRDGIFAYNEEAAQFEPAVTFYRFNKSNQKMERMENSQDTYLAQDAKIYGPTNSVRAMLSVGPTGEWCVGLPLPASRSPDSLDAYHFKEIVTPKGVYTYSEQKQDYEYRSHLENARAAKEANDRGWEAYRQKNWDRRVQEFQLGTERLKALAPLFWSWRVWW